MAVPAFALLLFAPDTGFADEPEQEGRTVYETAGFPQDADALGRICSHQAGIVGEEFLDCMVEQVGLVVGILDQLPMLPKWERNLLRQCVGRATAKKPGSIADFRQVVACQNQTRAAFQAAVQERLRRAEGGMSN